MATYAQTLDWLFSQLPMYQRTGSANYKIDLEKTWALMDLLGNPERKIKAIHVAGTNGKGSTSHLMASALQNAGYKTGLYTSPHLLDFRERVKINGAYISETSVIAFVDQFKTDFERLELSFFEMTVGLAFHHFVQQNVDIAVIEVGMGGRLDSTNVLHPLASVITNIGLDHQQFLGDTLPLIAAEKAGIIKKNTPVIIGETQPEIAAIFKAKAEENTAPLFFADQENAPNLGSDLKGIYQEKNKITAFIALRELKKAGFVISDKNIKEGFNNVVKNTGLLGRWQTVNQSPLAICDTGHNLEGIAQVVAQLELTPYKKLHIVWGMINDKNPEKYLALLPKTAHYYFTEPSIPRKLAVANLYVASKKVGLSGNTFPAVAEAYLSALKNAKPGDLVFVGGSTFVVADLLVALKK